MSEAITPGVTGAIVDNGNEDELAAAIVSVLANDDIYRSCYERAPAMAAYFSWERVAQQVAHVISREVGLMTW
jgi:glycosyltransferase involved in cell wall biosynthesis